MDGRKYLFPVCSGAEGDWPVCKGVRSDGILDSRLRLARERLHACERHGEDAPVRVEGRIVRVRSPATLHLVRVSFLYYEECPSHEFALGRLREVMAEEGVSGDVEVIKVEAEDQARGLKFVGSPTIRVDGQDIDPPGDASYALTCRAYRLEDDRISPLPSKDMIRRALRSIAGSSPG